MTKFSVCIPTYNRAYLIRKPLDSLVNQTFKDFEVLVVDDGSTDNTDEIVEPYKEKLNLKYIKKPNGGKHTALNTSLDHAQGELWIILDSDDEFVETALGEMNNIWEEYKDNPMICGIIGRSSVNGKLIGRPFEKDQEFISYVEFHFGLYGGQYGDCCECLRTETLKKYRWPENLETKFVPECYVFDQIGLTCKLVIANNNLVFKKVYYKEDGITMNVEAFVRKNLHGYLFNSISEIENIIPNAKQDEITFRAKKDIWINYYNLKRMDKNGEGPKVKRKTVLGLTVWIYINIRSKIYKILHR